MTQPKYRTDEEEAELQQVYQEYRAKLDDPHRGLLKRVVLGIIGIGALLAGLTTYLWTYIAGG